MICSHPVLTGISGGHAVCEGCNKCQTRHNCTLTFPRTDLDLRNVPMVLAEEQMCRSLAHEYVSAGAVTADAVATKVEAQFHTGPRADVIASFVWSHIKFILWMDDEDEL